MKKSDLKVGDLVYILKVTYYLMELEPNDHSFWIPKRKMLGTYQEISEVSPYGSVIIIKNNFGWSFRPEDFLHIKGTIYDQL